jgi:dTDP-4-dehydrorhamnose reductase
MKIVLIGANGQLGSDISNNIEIIPLNHNIISIENLDQVRTILKEIKPNIIINTAFYNVEKSEEEPEIAFLVNGIGNRNLAMVANELKSYLIHFSTNYVFDGKKGFSYIEKDLPNPLNVYGNTKLSGEYFIKAYTEKYAILRVSGLYGKYPCRSKDGRNFINTMIKLGTEQNEVKVVDDELFTPTSTEDISENLKFIIKEQPTGLFHMTAHGHCSWYEYAQVIFEKCNLSAKLVKIKSIDFNDKVKRPKYSVLENRALQKLELDHMKYWKDSLIKYLKEIQ